MNKPEYRTLKFFRGDQLIITAILQVHVRPLQGIQDMLYLLQLLTGMHGHWSTHVEFIGDVNPEIKDIISEIPNFHPGSLMLAQGTDKIVPAQDFITSFVIMTVLGDKETWDTFHEKTIETLKEDWLPSTIHTLFPDLIKNPLHRIHRAGLLENSNG